MHSQFFPPPLTCCVVLVVVDELRDGVEVVLLCQKKLALRRGAYVVMSAASCWFPAMRPVRLDSSRYKGQIFTCTETKCYLFKLVIRVQWRPWDVYVSQKKNTVLEGDVPTFCINNLHLSSCVVLCFRFRDKMFFWYVHKQMNPATCSAQMQQSIWVVESLSSYWPTTLGEQGHCVFPSLAGVPHQEASVFVLWSNTHRHVSHSVFTADWNLIKETEIITMRLVVCYTVI